VSRFQPYRRKRSYLIAVIIILLALLFSYTALKNLLGGRNYFQTAIYPAQWFTVTVLKGITNVPASLAGLRGLAKENDKLKTEIYWLKTKLAAVSSLKQENARLRAALAYKQQNHYRFKLLVAEVVGRSPSPWFSILTINRGRVNGVKENMPVITPNGLVGQVVEVSRNSSKVKLLIDSDSSVAAANQRSRDFGVVTGSPSNRLYMKYVAAEGDMRVGDEIVTSQISTIYPAEIPVGRVIKATKREHDLFYFIELKPAAQFSKLEEVFVVL